MTTPDIDDVVVDVAEEAQPAKMIVPWAEVLHSCWAEVLMPRAERTSDVG